MFRERYKTINESISPSPVLINTVINNETKFKTVPNKNNRLCFKPAVAALLALALLLGSVPVLAAQIPAVYELLYSVSPATAQFFMPINGKCVINGIELTASAVYIKDNKVEVLFSLKDLEGDRIDKTTNLGDCYWLHSSRSTVLNDIFADYDKRTKTATFLMSFVGEDIVGDKITFGVDSFYFGDSGREPILVDIDLADYARIFGIDRLIPLETPIFEATDALTVTAIGYVDGLFTVQTKVQAGKSGFIIVELRDGDGNIIDLSRSDKFTDPADTPPDYADVYDEYSFKVPPDEIASCSLWVGYHDSGERITGPWVVTFKLVPRVLG